ncbi:MAG: uroporphyrinogen-III synthetase [Neptuniibacter caesariensis]|uniref:Uroporphyrinogen-III synthase n=1 Tax=Neptuniibacter caesariensis TaxID=207954 RepID=A0A2G6JD68_NEPCE|nr:MAG: uroporphyrinogen-III synthetase [Neptuniibacter caesariensis]
MTDRLNGLRVLVTRPAHQAKALLQQLELQGAVPVSFPLLQIVPLSESDIGYHALKQKFLDLDLYQHVLFISPNAVQLGYNWIDQYWPQLPLGIQWLAIGKQTAAKLSNYGIDAYHSALGYDSEALLQSPALQKVAGDKVLIVRGEGGRETLAKELSARGAEVSYAEPYRRKCPEYSHQEIQQALFSEPLDAILISSGAGLENLLGLISNKDGKLITDSLFSCHLIVPSNRIKFKARQLGFNRITTASGPDDNSMINALMQ